MSNATRIDKLGAPLKGDHAASDVYDEPSIFDNLVEVFGGKSKFSLVARAHGR